MRYLQLEKYVFEFGVFKAANVDNLIPGEQINNNTTQSKKIPVVSDSTAAAYSKEIESRPVNLSLSDKQKTWKGFVKYLESISALMAAQCGYGVVKELSDDRIVLAFNEKDRFYYNMLMKPEKIKALKEHLNKYFGRNIAFSLILENSTEEKSLIKTESEIKSFQDEMLRETVENNPMVKRY